MSKMLVAVAALGLLAASPPPLSGRILAGPPTPNVPASQLRPPAGGLRLQLQCTASCGAMPINAPNRPPGSCWVGVTNSTSLTLPATTRITVMSAGHDIWPWGTLTAIRFPGQAIYFFTPTDATPCTATAG